MRRKCQRSPYWQLKDRKKDRILEMYELDLTMRTTVAILNDMWVPFSDVWHTEHTTICEHTEEGFDHTVDTWSALTPNHTPPHMTCKAAFRVDQHGVDNWLHLFPPIRNEKTCMRHVSHAQTTHWSLVERTTCGYTPRFCRLYCNWTNEWHCALFTDGSRHCL